MAKQTPKMLRASLLEQAPKTVNPEQVATWAARKHVHYQTASLPCQLKNWLASRQAPAASTTFSSALLAQGHTVDHPLPRSGG